MSTAAELRQAINDAKAGDEIVLADGVYAVQGNLSCRANGTAQAPITVRAANQGKARVEFDALEGFKVSGARWIFEDLHIKGVCANDSQCEHAWHVVGGADHTIIRRNRAWNFNAQIKANGEGDPRLFPDDVLVAFNEFFNEAPRQTGNPVTPIDVVGGRRWRVIGNYIHDFAKGGGNNISYAAFLKGNSRDGLFARNLVVCEQLHTGHIRLGLSFGGGGTGPDSICEDQTCTPEHQDGVMRNNIIAKCPTDVGIYINEGARTRIEHNTLYGTTGIDIRFAASTASVHGNVFAGRLRERNGGSITAQSHNQAQVTDQQWTQWFENPGGLDFRVKAGATIEDAGAPINGLTHDFCGAPRDGSPDVGAVERSGGGCDTTTPFHMSQTSPDMGDVDMGSADMGAADMGGADMGGASGDMGSTGQDMTTVDMGDADMGAVRDMAVTQDMGAAPDQGTDAPATPTAADEGCACASTPASPRPPALALLLGVLGMLAGMRRARRGHRAV